MRLKTPYLSIPELAIQNKNLTYFEILFYSKIITLSLNDGFAFASNTFYVEYFKVSTKTISNSIKNLKNNNLVEVKYVNNRRRIYPLNVFVGKEIARDIEKSCPNTIEKTFHHNIKDEYKRKDNTYTKQIPKWMSNPDMCNYERATDKEIEELEIMLKDITN